MEDAEFDRFAKDYLSTHERNVRVSGEAPDYFARYKIDEVRRRWTKTGAPEPRTVLDFGAGIGASLPHLAARFPTARIIALDVSSRSLAVAESRFGSGADYVCYDGVDLPVPDGGVDLVFSSCVFHHIDAQQHVDLFRRLRRALAPGGRMIIFEHNPFNPVTRYIVATCEFDENAVLISARDLAKRQKAAGFQAVRAFYTGFFPASLKALRPLERFMTAFPVGAQYYTEAVG
jgi:ubiquinone/menaquinone biosynthesis C-methylase UbiE